MGDTFLGDVTSLLGPIFGRIYHSAYSDESFEKLDLSESSLKAIRDAGDFYNRDKHDHALIELFKEIEKLLRELCDARQISIERPDAAKYIHELKETGLITECDMHILHGLRCYRNQAAHGDQYDRAIVTVLLILAIPLLSRLEIQLAGLRK